MTLQIKEVLNLYIFLMVSFSNHHPDDYQKLMKTKSKNSFKNSITNLKIFFKLQNSSRGTYERIVINLVVFNRHTLHRIIKSSTLKEIFIHKLNKPLTKSPHSIKKILTKSHNRFKKNLKKYLKEKK